MNEFFAMAHNGAIIKGAEKILQNFVRDEGTYLYLRNPDGTRVRIQNGFKLEHYEIVPIEIEKEDA